MSARPCTQCGKLVIFAKDRATDQWIALTNQASTWRIASPKLGTPYVVRDYRVLVSHYCTIDMPPAAMPEAEWHFSEPKEITGG